MLFNQDPPNGSPPWALDVSAGELLGRTHEELVLLLIQLRRQSAGVCKAMEACHIEIEAQVRLNGCWVALVMVLTNLVR